MKAIKLTIETRKHDLVSLEILAVEHEARGMAGVMVSPAALLSLVADARRVEKLERVAQLARDMPLTLGSGPAAELILALQDAGLLEE